MVTLSDPGHHLVQVTIELPTGAKSPEIQLPVWNALYQVRDFSQHLNWIRAEDLSGQPLPLTQLNKSRWRLDAAEHGARVRYEIYADDPDPYGAQLNSHHAFFNLAEILVYADDLRHENSEIRFDKLPSKWILATPLEKQGDAYVAQNYDQLVDSPVEISAFVERDFEGACGQYRVVLDRESDDSVERAKANLSAMVPQLQRVVAAASEWMNDCPFQNYMFIYHASESRGGGMEHAYSTAITIPAKHFDEVSPDLLGTTAHEFFHLWNVKRIRPQALEPVDYTQENYTRALWFSEGVDSTVAEYILLHAGLQDEKQYLDHLSTEITELEDRPARHTQSVEESSLDAWLEKYPYYGLPDRSISYYNKGELLGVLLDLAMREASDDHASLRDLFRWMNDHYAKQGKFFAESTSVREGAELLSHSGLRSFFERYVSGTADIPWNEFFARVGLQVNRQETVFSDPGFQAVQKFDQHPIVVIVQPGSEADRAGLQSGDAILKINKKSAGRDFEQVFSQLRPGEMLSLTVQHAGKDRVVEYKLASRRQTIFTLADLPNVTDRQRAARAAWLFDKSEKNPQ